MSIRQTLLPALRQHFPDRRFREGEASTEVATFAASHSEFGDLVIHDDGHEATLVLGTLTHTHIDAQYSRHASKGADQAVTEEVLEFLEDLFADRIVVWCVPGKSGGYYYVNRRPAHVPKDAKAFVWSGPATDPSRR